MDNGLGPLERNYDINVDKYQYIAERLNYRRRNHIFVPLYRNCDTGEYYIDDDNYGYKYVVAQFIWGFFFGAGILLTLSIACFVTFSIIIFTLYTMIQCVKNFTIDEEVPECKKSLMKYQL